MDISSLLLLQEARALTHQMFNNLFLFITTLGEDLILYLVLAAIHWCIKKQSAIYMLFNYHAASIVNNMLKITACIYRPWIRDARVLPVEAAKPAASGYSFPSGHTAKGAAVWGSLASRDFKQDKLLRRFLIGLVLLIGFSRNYLGVHTPQDVLVSLALACLLIALSEHLFIWMEKRPERDWYVLAGGLLLSVLLLIYACMKDYPIDYVDGVVLVAPASMIGGVFKASGGAIGFLVGWIWERKKIKFDETQGTWKEKMVRFLIGSSGLILILKTVNTVCHLLLGAFLGAWFNGFLVSIYITALYPIFMKYVIYKYVGIRR